MAKKEDKFTDAEALRFHASGRPGKIEIIATKPVATQRDLSLAYSPGVAAPVKAIADDPDTAYDYTAKGNLVAVISNGSAILGLGNLGAAASKPVMEGKAVLFKRFADVDSVDLEVDTKDADAFINCVKLLGPSFGGINLEDIGAPDCFIIEQQLRELMDIPVFHDDQHGTAIITAAGFLNALDLTGRDIKTTKVVAIGAGAACIACVELMKKMGLPHDNVTLIDREGVIYKGRTTGMNQWKSAHAVETDARTLEEALAGSDAVLGLAAGGILSQEMIKTMADKPIIFAMSNPEPEIHPADAREANPHAIIATGRSDYPNQVNNVLGFPYIFRGALDVRARTINDEMKIAAVQALAELAREDVPDEVVEAYGGARPKFGPDYIIPAPFDPRLIHTIPPKVAEAAMATGVARKNIEDLDAYAHELQARLDPTINSLSRMVSELTVKAPKRVVFAEAEEERVLRAAVNFGTAGYGVPILVGYEDTIRKGLREMGVDPNDYEIRNAKNTDRLDDYIDYLYRRLNRRGFLLRDVQRAVKRDRNVFSALMVATGDADTVVTGATRNYSVALRSIKKVIDPIAGTRPFGIAMVVGRDRTVFLADAAVNEKPSAEELVDIAEHSAAFVRRLGHEPRVAFTSFANFGNPQSERNEPLQGAVRLLRERGADFEFDGEMQADVALNPDMQKNYPFMGLSAPANILVMPSLNAANVAYKMMAEMGAGKVIGPILLSMSRSVQIVRMAANASDIVNMASISAMNAHHLEALGYGPKDCEEPADPSETFHAGDLDEL